MFTNHKKPLTVIFL